MKKMCQVLFSSLLIGCFVSFCVIVVNAATALTAISLSVFSNIMIGTPVDQEVADISASNPNFTISSYEFLNTNTIWTETDQPLLQINITANEGYQFANLTLDDISILNTTATIDSLSKEGTQTVSIIIKFPVLSQTIATPVNLRWSSDGKASWDTVPSASGYDVRLYRDGKMLGNLYYTNDPAIDFSVKMSHPSNYSFWVRARSSFHTSIKSDYAKSVSKEVDLALGTAFKNHRIGWKQDAIGWWYQKSDGSYAANEWFEIDGVHYYFDESGYLWNEDLPSEEILN